MKPNDLKTCVLRVENEERQTFGTAFRVSPDLAVTCAHVVQKAGAGPDQTVMVCFHRDGSRQLAQVLAHSWSPPDQEDVAFLRLKSAPEGMLPATLCPAAGSGSHDYIGLGYPEGGEVKARWPQGKIGGVVPVAGRKDGLLQMQGAEVDLGLSGAPILDLIGGHVIGMITGYQDPRYSEGHRSGHRPLVPPIRFAYATPAETLRDLCPQAIQLHPIMVPQSLVEGIRRLPTDYGTRIQNFLVEYLGAPEHPVPFGGREAALADLNDWLADPAAPPYLLLAAPAGRGKSALLVRWLERLRESDPDLSVVFVPVSLRFNTASQAIFFAALVARLAHLYDEDVPVDLSNGPEFWRGMASSYLGQGGPGGRLLVVLDGLDEAVDWEAGADLFPRQPPAGLRVVVSARYRADERGSEGWLHRLGWEGPGLTHILDLDPLTGKGVADVLEGMGFLLAELGRRVNIVAELHRLSEGDPLLVRLYVDDLWARGEAVVHLRPEDLLVGHLS